MEWMHFAGEPGEWNQIISGLGTPHILQTEQWGQVKARFGWQPLRLVWRQEGGSIQAAAQVLKRSLAPNGLPLSLAVLYVPKGPLLDWSDAPLRRQVLADLQAAARLERAIFVKIDPDVPIGRGTPDAPDADEDELGLALLTNLQQTGWRYSPDQIQFRNTVLLDLQLDLDQLLANMKQKTRYNLRLAERKGVTVRTGTCADLDLLYRMYAETANRDGFVIREAAYYQTLWSTFFEAGMAFPLIAEIQGQSIAAIVLFHFSGYACYMHGMSRPQDREKMPNHLLQWEAIRRLKELGVRTYDLWGAPDEFVPDDPLWGVYRFKEGFNGQVVRTVGAWDLPIRPLSYAVYTHLLPRLLTVMRRQGLDRTRRMVA